MKRRSVQQPAAMPRNDTDSLGDRQEASERDPDGALSMTPDRVEHLRSQLLTAITDDVWAEATTGFGDPDLASTGFTTRVEAE